MHLCYLDESGTPDVPGNTSHYVLVGLLIPIWHWKNCDRDITAIRRKYGLEESEIHTAWMMRAYLEQNKILNFRSMNYADRRHAVEKYRRGELLRLQRLPTNKPYKQARKNFRHTDAYIHLTFDERKAVLRDVAACISAWGFARLFAECIDKVNFTTAIPAKTIDEQALEQVVSRIEMYMKAISGSFEHEPLALLIHDNNDTVAKKHTALMKKFHTEGTLWTNVAHIVETPLFVNSELTGMVQIADLCGYALRRYLENGEDTLFNMIFHRADRRDGRTVGVRHFTPTCKCKICVSRARVPEIGPLQLDRDSDPTLPT
jgi:hypothetical protein